MDFAKVHHLGPKAFFVFLAGPSKYFVLPVLILLGLWFGYDWMPARYAQWIDWTIWGGSGLTLLIYLLMALRTFLEYKAYTYFFDEEAFIVRYGYVVDNEVALMYHHIRNVNIDRYIPDRLFGVSQLQIVMVGTPDEDHAPGMILPAIQKDKARLVQKELLRRARKHFFRREAGEE